MPSFATVAELGSWLQRDLIADAARAQLLLDSATDAVKAEVDQVLEAIADEVITLDGNGETILFLPELPVTDVAQIEVAGQVLLPDVGFTWNRLGVVRKLSGNWGYKQSSIEVTYDHGQTPVPPIAKVVVLEAAARAFVNPTGAAREDIGEGYTVSHAQVAFNQGAQIHLTDVERRMLDPLRVPAV
jgi:hypothetical protein